MADVESQEWNFPFEKPLHDVFPSLHEALNAFLSQIDSLSAPDRKTHELIRMVCTVIQRNAEGVQRHAMLAREVGASWDEIVGSIVLTLPSSGLLPAVEALPWARKGFDAAADLDVDDIDVDDIDEIDEVDAGEGGGDRGGAGAGASPAGSR